MIATKSTLASVLLGHQLFQFLGEEGGIVFLHQAVDFALFDPQFFQSANCLLPLCRAGFPFGQVEVGD